MKVLLYDTTNAFLTPGGKTTHALKLQQEISKLGVDIQFAQWWNKNQEDCDIIHFLSCDVKVAQLAKKKNIKTFMSLIFDYESNKSESQKRLCILKNQIINILPKSLSLGAYWKSFKYMDCIHFMHIQDQENALRYFPNEISKEKTIIIPHAYDPNDINISSHLNIKEMSLPTKYLVSCANISERKQSVLLAKLAKIAKVPIVFIGSKIDTDPYYQEFQLEIDNQYVFYPGYVSKEWKDCIESNASGYVLLSKGESGCIAVYEAAAYKLPLLLSDLPWAWGYENPQNISYCNFKDIEKAVEQLKSFYLNSCKLNHPPFTIRTWSEVAKCYVNEYYKILNNN